MKQPDALTSATLTHSDYTNTMQHHTVFWPCVTTPCQHFAQCTADNTIEHIQSDHIEPLPLPPAEIYLLKDHPTLLEYADSHELMHNCTQAVSLYSQEQCSRCGSNPATIHWSKQ